MQAKSGHLLDAENNVIEKEFSGITIQDYLDQRNNQGRTRSQKHNKDLVFSYKAEFNGSYNQPEKSTNDSSGFYSGQGEPMECDTSDIADTRVDPQIDNFESIVDQKDDIECIEIPDVDEMQTSSASNHNYVRSSDPLKMSDDDEVMTKRTTPADELMNDSQIGNILYLKFTDRTEHRSEMELSFNGDDNLETAFNQIVDVMDLEKSKSKFFNSKGNDN